MRVMFLKTDAGEIGWLSLVPQSKEEWENLRLFHGQSLRMVQNRELSAANIQAPILSIQPLGNA